MLLSDFVCQQLDIDAQLFMRLLDKKEVRVNSIKVVDNISLKCGDMVDVFLPQKFAKPKEIALNVVFSDDNIVVVNKQQGIEVDELQHLVVSQYSDAVLVHRLDRNTGGIVAFGRGQLNADLLILAFKERKVKKTYVARVHGKWQVDKAFKAWLFKDAKEKYVRIFDSKKVGCKDVETHFKTIQLGDDTTWIKAVPTTGRTHQIRAQLCHLGHPIVGEGKYSLQQFRQVNYEYSKKGIKYQQLFASELQFVELPQPLDYLNDKVFALKIEI